MSFFYSNSKRLMLLSLLAALMLCQIGCHRPDTYVPLVDSTYHLPDRVKGTSDKVVAKMIKRFNQNKVVNVVTIGQYYLISIPNSALFADQSPKVKAEGYGVLNQVADFTKQFRKISLTVYGYGSPYKSQKRERALSLARAREVGDYLLSQGIDSRFIFTKGAGSEKPISSFTQGGDRAPNSRIEIIFRDTIVN